MADEILFIPDGTTISPFPFDGALGSLTYSELLTAIGAPPLIGKIYLKDDAGTPHYWQLTVSAAGVLTTTDVGTVVPVEALVGIP